MKEKLIIRNFGPIKDVELDLGRFNILIGEQATGKSTVAKVLAVCRYFSYIINSDDFYFQQPFEDGLSAWGLSESIQENTTIFYECKHYSFTAKRGLKDDFWVDEEGNEEGFKVPFFETNLTPLSLEFTALLNELHKIIPPRPTGLGFGDIGWTIPYSFFLNDVKNVMDNPFYFPTERGLQSIFSLGQASIQNIENFLYTYFSKVDGALRSFKTETEIEALDIKYINTNGIGYVKKKGENDFKLLANAASGYQSTIPVILVIKYQNELRKKRKTFIVEEPELNLFPAAQNRVMQYLVNNIGSSDNRILLTTHSPYILTSLNNMMYAYQMGKKDEQRTSKIIAKKYWINPDDISAYMMSTDGKCEDIIDREEGMIRAEKIDSVSTKINEIFEKLLNIEFKENELNT